MKKIVHFLFFVCIFLGLYVPVLSIENDELFIDVNEDYGLYNELEYLYERGFIIPDNDNQFNPARTITREEFIRYAFELSCESCQRYDISPRIVARYRDNESFFDLTKDDLHFYCAEEADARDYLLRYAPSHVCQNGVTQNGESPFCADDTISKQEALRSALLISGVYTLEDYQVDLDMLRNGEIATSLGGSEVQAYDSNGNINPYFLYLRKALSYSIEVGDISGNLRTYTLLSLDDSNNIEPTKNVSREDFTYMLYVLAQSMICEKESGDFSSIIDIYPANCNPLEKGTLDPNCGKEPLEENTRIYDLVTTSNGCKVNEEGEEFDPEKNIVWRLHHIDSGTHSVEMGSYIDNASFDRDGEWRIYLGVFDTCGKSSGAMNTIYVGGEQTGKNSLSIEANPTSVILGNEVSLRALAPEGVDEDFIWELSDDTVLVGEEVSHEFLEPGTFRVELRTGEVTAHVYVHVYEQDLDIATFIDVYESSCEGPENKDSGECSKADLTIPADIYDFFANTAGVCEEGALEQNITWTFTNTNTGESQTVSGLYVNDFRFPQDGLWKVRLEIVDNCGWRGEAESFIQIGEGGENEVSLGIEADGINISPGDTVNFTGLSSDPNANDFTWDFGDGNSGDGQNVSHAFENEGTYTIQLESGGNTAFVTINVYEDDSGDSDGDGVVDSEDQCPNTPGAAENNGCPIVPGDSDGDGILDPVDECPNEFGTSEFNGCPGDEGEGPIGLCGGANGGCEEGYVCSIYPGGPGQGVCLLDNVCALTLDGGGSGNVVCNTCPCDYSIDFNSELKICDVVFPAITSPDGSQIYSRGPAYQILE